MEDLIRRFLKERRFAFVGLSRDAAAFSRGLFRELRARGYDVIPVNPELGAVEGRHCYARLQDISPPVRAALLLTRPAVTEQVVRDAVEAGVTLVWMHRGSGVGAVSPAAAAYGRSQGVEVIEGACPYMFLPRSGVVHRVHGFFHRLLALGADQP
jgi:predicted CoA-binding protein